MRPLAWHQEEGKEVDDKYVMGFTYLGKQGQCAEGKEFGGECAKRCLDEKFDGKYAKFDGQWADFFLDESFQTVGQGKKFDGKCANGFGMKCEDFAAKFAIGWPAELQFIMLEMILTLSRFCVQKGTQPSLAVQVELTLPGIG